MITRKVTTAIVVSFVLLITMCTSHTANIDWLIEWKLKSNLDSAAVHGVLSHKITLITDSYSPKISKDTIVGDSLFLGYISATGNSNLIEDIPNNTKVHIVFNIDTVPVFDSVLSFSDFDFKPGYSTIFDCVVNKVSTKTIYLPVHPTVGIKQ